MLTQCKLNAMKNVTFKEKQRFDRYEVLVLLVTLCLALVALMTAELFNPHDDLVLRLVVMSVLLLGIGTRAVQMYSSRLKVSVNHKRIKYNLQSALGQSGKIRLSDIAAIEPIATTGDMTRFSNPWFSPLDDERFISVTGRNGVAVRTNSGERYFIGTRRPVEMFEAIRQLLEARQLETA